MVFNSLRNPPDEAKLDDRKDTLKERGQSPGPVALDVGGSKRQPTANESAQVPEAVVYGCNSATVLWMCDLSKQHWAG